MKGISHLATVLLAALTIALVSAQEESSIPTECPENNDGNATHIAHESNCNLFYKCDHGEKVLHVCPDGLNFNAELQVCDWPENSGCTSTSSDDSDNSDSGVPSSSTTEAVVEIITTEAAAEILTTEAASGDSEEPGSDATDAAVVIPTECPANNEGDAVHLAHESDCGLYYLCNHGEKVERQCPAGLSFNAALQVCDWPENSGCTSSSSDDSGNSDSGDSDSGDSDSGHSDSGDSDSGVPASSTTEAASGDSEEPGSDATDAAVVIPTECPANNEGDAVHLAHESDCGLYYQCNHGEKIERQCPAGLSFNAALQVCDWPENSGCTSSSSNDSGNSDSGDSDSGDSDSGDSDSGDSDSGDSDSGVPASSTTEAAPIDSEEPSSDATEAAVVIPTECPANNEGDAVHIAHESDCGLYYQCNFGEKVERQCPAGLSFNAALQVCDWPENSGCTSSSSDDSNDSDSGVPESTSAPETESSGESNDDTTEDAAEIITTEAAPGDSEEPSADATEAAVVIPTECPANNEGDAVHLAHESDCGSFYKCDHGEKVLQECPAGLSFNAALQVCDWSENSGCISSSSDDSDNSDSGVSGGSNSNEDDSSNDNEEADSDSNESETKSSNEEGSSNEGQNEVSGSETTEAQITVPTECPADNEGDAVHIAHESDCHLFYKCDHGEKVLFECPAGLYFSAEEQVCEWRESSGCLQSN